MAPSQPGCRCLLLPQVAAYCNGRDRVTEYDCLLLQHVLWQTPEQVDRIADWILGQLAADDGVKQVRPAPPGREACWLQIAMKWHEALWLQIAMEWVHIGAALSKYSCNFQSAPALLFWCGKCDAVC